MPFTNYSYWWDYETFDYVKDVVGIGKFFNIMDSKAHTTDHMDTRSDGYSFLKYLDQKDEKGYYSGEKFEYRLNSDYFRDTHFSKLEEKKYNILATGCSNTFGHGLPEECTWPRLLEEMIKSTNKDVRVFNLGSPGLGIDVIINNVISFIDKYGVPNAVIAFLPDMNRHIIYNPNFEKYRIYTPTIDDIKNKKNDQALFFKNKYYRFEDRIYQSINQIKMLESLCRGYGIKLLWQSWEGNSNKLYEHVGFKDFIQSDKSYNWYYYDSDKINDSIDLSEDKYKEYRTFARDSAHPGIEFHASVANSFYDNLKEHLENN